MAHPNNWGKFDPTLLADNFESWRQGLAIPLQKVVRDVEGMLTNGLLVRDNAYAALISLDCQHGVEKVFANPFGATKRPIGFRLLTCENAVGQPLEFSGAPVAIAGAPALNRQRADGLLGLTMQYDLGHTKPFARLGKTAVQAIGNAGAGTAVQWDSNTISADGIISIASNSRITVSEAGLYLFTGNLEYVTNAVGIRNQLFAYNGATTFTQPDGTRGYVQAMNTGAAFGVAVAGSALFVMAAGSYVEMFGYQNSGGALNITTFSQLQVARLRNDTAPTARVTFVLEGG